MDDSLIYSSLNVSIMKTRMPFFVLTLTFALFLVSCEKETLVEEPVPVEVTDLDLPEISIPEISNANTLFEVLPDSLRQWLTTAGAEVDGAEVRSLVEGDERAVTLRNANLSYFRVVLEGSTLGGQYPFRRSGCLILSPTIRPVGGNQVPNDENILDLGLFSGMPVVGQRGAINFMTNSAMCQYGNSGCHNAAAAIDAVDMGYLPEYRALVIQLDGRFFNNAAAGTSVLSFLNLFNASDNFAQAMPYHIISGYMVVQFSEDFRSLAGEIKFYGSSLFGHSPVEYRASFAGRPTSYCKE